MEEKGVVEFVTPSGSACRVGIRAELVHADAKIGDSICVNGCCLTVVSIDKQLLEFRCGKRNVKSYKIWANLFQGSFVNLERSVKPGDRLGGHYVSGHVDALGTVQQRRDDGTMV